MIIITARKRSLGQGNIFTPVCHSVHSGGAWSGGGSSGPGGCLVLWRGLLPGVVPGPGGCLVETPRPPDGYCCGRYASYWNAFLLHLLSDGFVSRIPAR